MQWMISFEEEVEALEEVKEWREILLEMAETEARGREGVVELEIFADWPSAGKEREAIAAAISSRKKKVGREREREESFVIGIWEEERRMAWPWERGRISGSSDL